jgi:maltooligosyltrehalose trehalohydrolase
MNTLLDDYIPVGPRKTGPDRFEFTVWAPLARTVELVLGESDRTLPMEPGSGRMAGYHRIEADNVRPGDRYAFRIDKRETRPDPASGYQPDGVHAASAVVDHEAFAWSDEGFRAPLLDTALIYELHVGTFTPEGTFQAAAGKLDHLADLGVNVVEVMPVAAFPGSRNWGYDGVYPYAVQHSYGGPDGFKGFVDDCHSRGMAVVLDVVYNHLGPEGNYTREFGPYFTDRYHTPWGEAVNFDGPHSDGVRNYVVGNALHWFANYHVDGLRLDAIHAIFDQRPTHILAELAQAAREFGRIHGKRPGRTPWLISESHLNDPRLTAPLSDHGLGSDSVWNDDFHHSVHTLLTGESDGYYVDYGRLEQLGESLRSGFCYQGGYSRFRDRSHGAPVDPRTPGKAYCNWLQTHDQVGNRMNGDRLASLTDFESLKLGAGLLILPPFLPMLFMGEEYGEDTPFLYFVDHGDPQLVEAVRQGRKEEFSRFEWTGQPPDPAAVETFEASRLDWSKPPSGRHKMLLAWHKTLVSLRRSLSCLANTDLSLTRVWEDHGAGLLFMQRSRGAERALAVFNLDARQREVGLDSLLPDGDYRLVLDSADPAWGGTGSSMPRRLAGTAAMPGRSLTLYHGKETVR